MPRRLHRRVECRPQRRCLWCGATFVPPRYTKWCSGFCRRDASRAPKIWALITWTQRRDRNFDASWSYHPAERVAPYLAPSDGRPFTIVDISKPVRPHPSIAALMFTRYVEGADPYPSHRAKRPSDRPSAVNPD